MRKKKKKKLKRENTQKIIITSHVNHNNRTIKLHSHKEEGQDSQNKSHTYQQNNDISFDPNTAANPG